MSRIVVKNLPKKISVNKLKEIFSEKGHITDLQPKYTKNGAFRQFAFIGYKTEEEAQAAKDYFHNTFIQTSKVKVEICRPLGDADKVRSWSKDSKEMPVKKTQNGEKQIVENENVKELEKDSQFAEFMKVSSGNRKSNPLWCDDAIEFESDRKEKISDESGNNSEGEENGDNSDENVPPRRHISDMQYLRSKIERSDNSSEANESLVQGRKAGAHQNLYTVKLRKLPNDCKKKHLKDFFCPLKLVSIRLPPRAKGFAYVGFATEKDMKKALNKHRGFLDGHRVDVVVYQKKEEENVSQENVKQAEESKKEDALELIAETGRLFVRNLCYAVTEEEMQELFSKIGPIAEIHIPKDFYTKKGIGYAFVEYVFAEHAVKAYTELDCSIFQGRNLHILPGKPKYETVVDSQDMTFKEKKASKIKSSKNSPQNWNTLFLGENSVTDAMVEKYGIPKAKLLSDNAEESVMTRLALGETELVKQTRAFLLRHGVKLDSFSQPDSATCSKTVIIVKNLPVNTTATQLEAAFAIYGDVNKVILPPPGITGLVEFKDATEAKTAYEKLIFSRFVNKLILLQWAPLDVFIPEPVEENVDKVQEEDSQIHEQQKKADESGDEEEENMEEEEDDAENYIPPEGTTLFVKNLNFDTSEESLRKHFEGCGPLHSVSISKKRNIKSGKLLSMGFGFVQYQKKSSAVTAMQDLQLSNLDGHSLELKYSKRATLPDVVPVKRKKSKMVEQKTSKICVRNIPFEATEKEVKELFQNFGDIKGVRLPKNDFSTHHRGFGFIDYVHKRCAKKAFEAMCHNTHLLGRRLVLEWANPESEDVSELRKKTSRDFDQRGPDRRVKKSKLLQDVIMAKRFDE